MTRTAARSETGRVREDNEDRYVVHESRGTLLLAVADGVGGSAGGEVAANAAVVELADRFFAATADRAIEERLTDAIRDANTAVLHAAEASGNGDAATTIVAAAITGDRAIIANLGDSRAYLVRDGQPRQLTEDHHAERSAAITRFAGDPRGVQPDVFVEDLRPGDRLVLCSDGLTRHVDASEIATLAADAEPGQATDALVELALSRGGEDNVTVVVHTVAPEPRFAMPSRRALALGMVVAVAVLIVATAAILLFANAPFAPTPAPSVSPTPSASPTPTVSP
ncbi:MAG TPA: protein phosphatase 2C domain-containing protein [Candidatus Limnocylindria bacterium]